MANADAGPDTVRGLRRVPHNVGFAYTPSR
jgi:hypothetical protein